MSGWNTKPRRPACLHWGLIAASLELMRFNVGDMWTCTCGVKFIVVRTDNGKVLREVS